jgi:uncharacterized protein (DUF111 family)
MAKLKKILSELNWGGYKIHPGQVVTYKDFPAFKTQTQVQESEDHEVSMAQSSLDSIIKYVNHLKTQIGTVEKEIPAWIQDHIAKAESYIQQSANHYHEYGGESGVVETVGLNENDDEWVAFKILNNSPKKKLIKVLGSHRAAKFWATKNTAKLFVLDDTIQSVGIQSMESWKTDLWK